MNSIYRSSLVQRAAVAQWRAMYPAAERKFSAKDIWAELTPEIVLELASKPVVDPLDAPSPVLNGASVRQHVADIDVASMEARGLDKSDMEALHDAAAALALWMQPDGTPLAPRYDVKALGDQFSTMVANPVTPEEMPFMVADSLERIIGNEGRIPYSARGRLFPVILSFRPVGPIRLDSEVGRAVLSGAIVSAPPKIHFIRCNPSSVAGQRGETVWAILHLPVYESYEKDGMARIGQSRWASKGSVFPGVARSFRSIALAADARYELHQALSTYRRISAQFAEQGDARYSDDPVRTQGIQLDVAPRFQLGPKAAAIC